MTARAAASAGSIRRARADEAPLLSDITWRAVSSWGYEPEMMEWTRDALTVRPEYLTSMQVYVLEEDGRVTGFYILRGEAPEIDMYFLMVEPDVIGTGRGKRLWLHAVEIARGLGATVLTLDCDPNAEPFYRAMGAVNVGERSWHPPTRPDWRLQVMRFEIPKAVTDPEHGSPA